MERTCAYCFDRFEPRSAVQEFCSKLCRTLKIEEDSFDGSDFMDPARIRRNIAAILDDDGSWLTEAYSLAIQTESLLRRLESIETTLPNKELVV